MTRTDDANFVVEGDDLVLARPVFEADAASFDTGPHQVAIDRDPSLRLPRHVMKHFQIVAGEGADNAQRHAIPNPIEGRVWCRLNYDRGRLRQTINAIGMADFAEYDAGGLARIFEAVRALNAYMHKGAAPLSGTLVSVICAK
ncbi:hypothetical protein M9M90_12420 [Phenylobacterium sp. LH3H17]|uniref:hypothetical protein n=1 Tax=Phenylobacterium sp. LH3H17 TaxID=2903901 RepID=UPI0020C9647F|nr:hypothetical protein [Phenylobacterium sp. LH3H17]UTP38038.1 hypothetical protein M9M90_12420 [Phenylobacterium sp. LH3H17]